jgi:hypothetical protein
MMRMDGRELRRPRGAVLGPLGLLLIAVVTGFGMWRVLMRDGGGSTDARLTRHESRR